MSTEAAETETKIERSEEELQKIREMHSELVKHALEMQAARRKLSQEEEQILQRRHRGEDDQFRDLSFEIRKAYLDRIEKHARVLKEATHSELLAAAVKLAERRAELTDTMRQVKEHASDPNFRKLADEIHTFEQKKLEAIRKQRAPLVSQLHAELKTRSIADLRHVVETEAEAVAALEAEIAGASASSE